MSHKISVIIPVYNAAGSLERCVESLVYGEIQDIDIILVEDCSSDNSWNICCELSERFDNVRIFKNPKNSGVSFTRNHGIEVAEGKYILFVDSDDWVSKKYVRTLFDTSEQFPDSMIICGLHFRDEVAGYRRDYLWDDSKNRINIVPQKKFFELSERFLLQQLWNKIFYRDIIEQYHIRFDESQSMGEDFQFVLDYLEKLQTKQCVVLNEALYYYIRANGTSLMSKFGLEQHGKEFERYSQLLRICGDNDSEVQKKYKNVIENVKKNFVYQIVHSNYSRKEKLMAINQIIKNKKASEYYMQQQILMCKEKAVSFLYKCREFPKRVQGRLQRDKRDRVALKAKKLMKNENFTIISQNCIGGIFYHDMGMQFLSPTVNLFFKEPDFMKFVHNLEYYIGLELEISWDEEYPVGQLDDVTVYFMHYHTCREAKDTWEKRKKRINWEKIMVVSTDMEGFDDSTWKEWEKVQYPKVLFSATERNSAEVVYFPQYEKMGHVPDLIPNREFYKDNVLLTLANSL